MLKAFVANKSESCMFRSELACVTNLSFLSLRKGDAKIMYRSRILKNWEDNMFIAPRLHRHSSLRLVLARGLLAVSPD